MKRKKRPLEGIKKHLSKAAVAAVAVSTWEAAWWMIRVERRSAMYAAARARADALGLPLLVVGAPDSWVTGGYPCGDITIDIEPTSSCPNFISADITKSIPLANLSCVAFVSCVLEYVNDYEAAMSELKRVAGDNLYVCNVEPWTLTAYLFPGAKRTVPAMAPTT
jgi:hypothetical protein